jgi:hypothetical protein
MEKTRILFLASNPRSTQALRLDEEWRSIFDRIRSGSYRNNLELTTRLAVRPRDLTDALLETQPHIIHFSGHGDPAGNIILEAEDGQSHPVTPDAMVSIFRAIGNQVRTVLVNACYSKIQADALAGVVDSVIGMSQPISDKAAIVFAAGFYQAISYGRPVKIAFELGTACLQMEGIPEHTTPVLMGPCVRTGQVSGWHVLHDFPLGPAVRPERIPPSLKAEYARIFPGADAREVVLEANQYRMEADPEKDPVPMVIDLARLVIPEKNHSRTFWDEAFPQAGLKSPRMLAALLLVVDPIQFEESARQKREQLLQYLRTIKQ